jgi:hypothetical protein
MNNFLSKMSRRERLYVIICGVVLVAGIVIYPAFKASGAHRAEQLEQLHEAQVLLSDYQNMLDAKEAVQTENEALRSALGNTQGLLFDSVGNAVMTQAMMVKRLNQFGPDLELEISSAKSSLRDVPGQFNFSVKGEGRYPEILNFFYQLETYRPLIVIDGLNLSIQKKRQGRTRPWMRNRQSQESAEAEPTEPDMRLQMSIHINCREAEEGAQ